MASRAESWLRKHGFDDPDSMDPEVVRVACAEIVGPENLEGLRDFFDSEGRVWRYNAPNSLRTYTRCALKYAAVKELFDQARQLNKDREKLFG